MVPRPVLAVLLLFPITDKTEAARREREWAGGAGAAFVCPPVCPAQPAQRFRLCGRPEKAAAAGLKCTAVHLHKTTHHGSLSHCPRQL